MPIAEPSHPVPRGLHAMNMRWSDLLFAHWAVEADAMQALLPEGLRVDTWDGLAWVGVVPFLMSRVRAPMLPPVPGTSRFPELNVRTYVRPADPANADEDRPGVYFFSLDAANPLAVRAARTLFHLRYRDAEMSCGAADDGEIAFSSRRTERRFPPAELHVRYRPTGAYEPVMAGTHEDFLTTRYCLYADDSSGRLYRGDIDHDPWRLAPATATFECQDMLGGHGITVRPGEPRLHMAEAVDVRAWIIKRVRSTADVGVTEGAA